MSFTQDCKTYQIQQECTENVNAKVGDQNWDHERAMGNHRLGEINDNGERL